MNVLLRHECTPRGIFCVYQFIGPANAPPIILRDGTVTEAEAHWYCPPVGSLAGSRGHICASKLVYFLQQIVSCPCMWAVTQRGGQDLG